MSTVPRIRMRETRDGAPDGIHIHRYHAGREYDGASAPPMSAMLAAIFLRDGVAEEVRPDPPAPPSGASARRAKAGPAETKEST